MQDPALIDTIFSVIILLFSVVAHEVSHGYAALALGDPTARLAGRLTMNPLKHIDPVGSVLVPIVTSMAGFGFGWAKPVPYNPYNLRDQKWGDTKVALAGPFTNFAIAIFFGLLLRFGGHGYFPSEVIHVLSIIVGINLALAVFNLVPIPPLDGSKLIANALPFRYRYIYDYLVRYSLVLFAIFLIFFWNLLQPVIVWLFSSIVGVS